MFCGGAMMKKEYYVFNRKYKLFPCIFFSKTLPFIASSANFNNLSLTRLSSSLSSSAISATGSHGFTDLILIAIKYSLSDFFGFFLFFILSHAENMYRLYICFMLHVASNKSFKYYSLHRTLY